MTVLVGNHDFLTGCKLNGDSVLNAEFCLEYVEISTNGVQQQLLNMQQRSRLCRVVLHRHIVLKSFDNTTELTIREKRGLSPKYLCHQQKRLVLCSTYVLSSADDQGLARCTIVKLVYMPTYTPSSIVSSAISSFCTWYCTVSIISITWNRQTRSGAILIRYSASI